VDTSVLTGEPFPRKVPDDNGGHQQQGEGGGGGRQMWSGCSVKQGSAYCLVESTGLETEVGHAAKLMQQNSGRRIGLLEKKILGMAKAIILGTLAVVVVIVIIQIKVRHEDWALVVVRALSLTIASVPVALPLVMQIMMTVGR